MTMIQYVNTTNYATDTEVEVHRPNCQHVAYFRTARLFWDGADAGLADLDTARATWEEYNSDFIAEAEDMGEPVESAAWPVTVYPCTGLVETKTTIRK
ncbi:hypothetical protein [Brevibacterium aurantiacum]|uniref:Uncharacterized protein n=1 Tax=Brevibacterium aurantiacum TaxID=273384 RepID=A0A2H1KPS8_BREAU|nr:hypothetical protein [Brevibacterium aurantiacum]SMY01242.1 hypothetical protein BAURA63_03522 [Brevibacterium aurantiacum]